MIFVHFFQSIVYNNTSLTPPPFIEEPVPIQVTERSYLYDVYAICRAIDFNCVYSIFHPNLLEAVC